MPELSVTADPQRYTCLGPDRPYQFELFSNYVRDIINVNGNGLVVEYPGVFKRLV